MEPRRRISPSSPLARKAPSPPRVPGTGREQPPGAQGRCMIPLQWSFSLKKETNCVVKDLNYLYLKMVV